MRGNDGGEGKEEGMMEGGSMMGGGLGGSNEKNV